MVEGISDDILRRIRENDATLIGVEAYDMDDERAIASAKALTNNTNVTSVAFSIESEDELLPDLLFSSRGMLAMAKMLKINRSITRFESVNNSFGEEETRTYMEAFTVNDTLEIVSFHEAMIDDGIAFIFTDGLRSNRSITKVSFPGMNDITDEGMHALSKANERIQFDFGMNESVVSHVEWSIKARQHYRELMKKLGFNPDDDNGQEQDNRGR